MWVMVGSGSSWGPTSFVAGYEEEDWVFEFWAFGSVCDSVEFFVVEDVFFFDGWLFCVVE